MTDKEKIIIDGVDVSTCKGLKYKPDGIKKPICLGGGIRGIYRSCLCEKNQNCHFKQLARKTQECEELKEELNGSEKWRVKAESLNEKLSIEKYRYLKALEEIREIACNEMCDMLGHFCTSCDDKPTCKTLKILNIINKARDGK